MNRKAWSSLALVLALGFTAPASASARTVFGFQIGINAPPPPRVYYAAPPPVVFVPESGVYVVRDDVGGCDEFSYGGVWYMNNGDYWYRARSYQGPFVAVDVRAVPQPIFSVPAQRWHHYPPGLAKWHEGHGRDEHGHDREDHGRDRDDHDHGRWHS